MTQTLTLDEEYEELTSYEDYVRGELRGVKDQLPFHFLASKSISGKHIYIFLINYKAYPLYAIVDEITHLVKITRKSPDTSDYFLRAEVSEDELVFPYLDYCNIIAKALLLIASSNYMWVPVFGASEHSRKLVDLDRTIFEERVREVVSLNKE